MDFDSLIQNIKKLYQIVHNKETEVVLTYKGTCYGVTKPLHLRCDQREVNSATHESAATELFNLLKEELRTKIVSAEKSTADLKKVLNAFAN